MKTYLKLIISILAVAFFGMQLSYAISTSKVNRMENQEVKQEVTVDELQLPEAKLPVLKVNGQKDGTEVYLQSLDIQVEVTGNIASTKYVMVFKNRT
ncbi:MAG: hypothetical protein LBN11_06315, partial [Tannerella sp.]|nr:hypothetical protein [Tannerella sp.]